MAFTDHVARIDRAAQQHLGGITVTYAPEDGDPVDVTGIFDENFVLLSPGESAVEQRGPAVWLRLADLPVHPDDDDPTLTIGEHTYRVRERQADGPDGGTIRLLLHRTDI